MKDNVGAQLHDISVVVKERSLLNSTPSLISENVKRLICDIPSSNGTLSPKVKYLVLTQQIFTNHDYKRNNDRHEVLDMVDRHHREPNYISVVVPTPLNLEARCSLARAFLSVGKKISTLQR